MSDSIRQLYTNAGLTPPKGKGVHTMKFHRCVVDCAKGQGRVIVGKVNCWAVCMSSIGREEAVKKAHQSDHLAQALMTKGRK